MNKIAMIKLIQSCGAGLALAASQHLSAAEAKDPDRIIQYRGAIPMLEQGAWGKDAELRFEIYRSPAGGTPFWSESRLVKVNTNGWVNLNLGEVEALPDEAFTSAFRFLSIWQDETEFLPRKQIANLAYVAAYEEAGASPESYLEKSLFAARAAAALAPNRENRLDKLVDCGGFFMEVHPRPPANWLEAAAAAKKLGASLPTFEEWYAACEQRKDLAGMAGHYEWVTPWVYEPMIHARLHEFYRGKPVACFYDELSPMNAYPFRLIKRSPAPAK